MLGPERKKGASVFLERKKRKILDERNKSIEYI
jgi:hypothetical protein